MKAFRTIQAWVVVCLALAFSLGAAGGKKPWEREASDRWSAETVSKILRNSPWARERLSGSVYSGDSVLTWIVRFHTARPVELALARAKELGTRWIADPSPDLTARDQILVSLQIYCCVDEQAAGNGRTRTQQRRRVSDLLPLKDPSFPMGNVLLFTSKDDQPVRARQYQITENSKDKLEVFFSFPRVNPAGTPTIKPVRKKLRFRAVLSDRLHVDAAFDLRQMDFEGKRAF